MSFAAAAFVATASAQIRPDLSAISDAAKSGKLPLQPTGFPNLPPKSGEQPPRDSSTDFRMIRGNLYQSGNKVKVTDGAEFVIRGYHVYCDSAEGDLNTRIFTLKGGVRVVGKDATIEGKEVTVDFAKRSYVAHDAKSQIQPGVTQGKLTGPLYTRGKESFGNEGETTTNYGGVTTCDEPDPHYEIAADQIVVRPGRRAIFRKVRFKLFGRTVFRLPFLSIPLDDRNYNNLPEIGHSPDEGFYIKTRWGIPLKGQADLLTHVDYMSRLGLGLGGDLRYRTAKGDGSINIYKITGMADSLNFAASNRQTFGWGTLALDNTYQNNNYLTAPGSTIMSNRIVATLPQKRNASDTLSFTNTTSESTGFKTRNQALGVQDTREVIGIKTSVNVNILKDTSTFSGGNSSQREEADLLVRAEKDLSLATAQLDYQRSIPIGETTNFYGGSNRTPVVTLTSDAKRLVGDQFAKVWPFTTELSLGEFTDSNAASSVTRSEFGLTFQHPDRSMKRFTSQFNGRFRQSVYSDDTAQYLMDFGGQVSYKLGKDTAANLRYNYLRPYGYSPLQIDRTGRTNQASVDVSYRPIRTLLAGIQTGYDALRLEQKETPWQQVGVRLEYLPRDFLMVRALSTYDPFQSAWSSVRVDLTYKPGATLLSMGSQYDGIRHTWTNVNLYLDNLKWGKSKIAAILAYNGFSHQFDTQQYNVIYDLHCAEAVISVSEYGTGFRSGRTISFFMRLKALPFDLPFGVGQRGQPLGTGTGRDF